MPSTSRIDIRVSEEEKQIIDKKANENGLSISDYIRMVALRAEIKIKIKEP